MSGPSTVRDRRLLALSLFGSITTGLGLRLWNLLGQVMGGDELHAVRAAARMTLPEILTTYSVTDYSIPLTALYRLWMSAGLTLSELGFRLPVILCGCIALYVLPRAFLGKVDRVAVELYGWLVAVSPGLVLYSRIARSYLPMLLTGLGAVMAFEAWWRTRERRYAFLYIGLGGLAVWLHLGAGPLVVSPFLFALGDLVRLVRRGEERGRRLLELAALGGGLALALAAFLVPARASLLALVAGKREVGQSVSLATVWDVLKLQAGTPSDTMTALFWLAALTGLVLLVRDRPRAGFLTLTVALGHLAGLLILSPVGLEQPLILNRYLLPILPFVLLWMAYALGRLWARKTAGCAFWAAQRYAVRLFMLFFFWTGPFLQPGFRTSSFMHHNDFAGFFAPRSTLPAEVVPEIYRRLPSGPVLEAPWPTVWDFCRSFYIYQGIHHERVLVSAPRDLPRDPRIAFRNEVPPDPAAFLASPARTLIVHLRLPWEEDRVIDPPGRPARPMRPALRHALRQDGEELAARLTREWGPPDSGDATVWVWDLERVRQDAGKVADFEKPPSPPRALPWAEELRPVGPKQIPAGGRAEGPGSLSPGQRPGWGGSPPHGTSPAPASGPRPGRI
jgi:hypothetical protein